MTLAAAPGVRTSNRPFPFALYPGALTDDVRASIAGWMSHEATWLHEEHGFYRNGRCGNPRSALRCPAAVAYAESTIAAYRQFVEECFDVTLDRTHAQVVAHRLGAGDYIGPHNDRPSGPTETHRVLVHVRGDRLVGGDLVLGRGAETVHVPFEDGLLVAFPLSGFSFHEVTPVEAGVRDTLVYSFWRREALPGAQGDASDMPASAVGLLEERGAFAVPHRSTHAHRRTGSLGEHLVAVARTLRRWGLDEQVVTAGLLHSVYGPLGFGQQLISRSQRDLVRDAVGPLPERLAHLFSALDRDSLERIRPGGRVTGLLDDGTVVELDDSEILALDRMVWANLVAQGDSLDEASRRSLADRARADRGLPAAMADDLRKFSLDR